MLKLLGSLCILAAGGGLRMEQVRGRRREIRAYQGVIAALREMGEAIRLNRTPLPRLIRQAAARRREGAFLFQTVGQALEGGTPLPDAWRSAALAMPWREADRLTLAELAEQLTGDAEQVCKGIQLVCNLLTGTLEELQRQQPDFEKRSTALCFSGAAMLIILLI